jgi:hypothetical protein
MRRLLQFPHRHEAAFLRGEVDLRRIGKTAMGRVHLNAFLIRCLGRFSLADGSAFQRHRIVERPWMWMTVPGGAAQVSGTGPAPE